MKLKNFFERYYGYSYQNICGNHMIMGTFVRSISYCWYLGLPIEGSLAFMFCHGLLALAAFTDINKQSPELYSNLEQYHNLFDD
jgi:hypothetical protein